MENPTQPKGEATWGRGTTISVKAPEDNLPGHEHEVEPANDLATESPAKKLAKIVLERGIYGLHDPRAYLGPTVGANRPRRLASSSASIG